MMGNTNQDQIGKTFLILIFISFLNWSLLLVVESMLNCGGEKNINCGGL